MDLKEYIADIPDFPEPGVLFRDVTPLLADKDAYKEAIRLLVEFAKEKMLMLLLDQKQEDFYLDVLLRQN